MSPTSLLRIAVRGGVAMRKSAKHSFFVTNFQTVTVVYKEVCDDFDIFVMNGTLLHVTRQYVACFVFLF